MEQKYDCNLDAKKSSYEKFEKKYSNPESTNLSIPLKQKTKKVKNLYFELENHNFQIIRKKADLIDINKKEEIQNSLNDKNDENFNKKNIINEVKLDEKRKDSIKKNVYTNKNHFKDSIRKIYNLLNSYYKDIDINFKNDNINNNCKNFLHKNNFQENQNKDKFPYPQDKMKNSIPYIHDRDYQNHNPFIFNDNKFQSYYFPKNAFTINNEYNFYFTNNINKYSYNFHSNENKRNRKKIEPTFFLINLDNILKGIDTRTTVMIRHIPNKYSYQNILDEINVACKNKYDFFYLPLDSDNNCNLGYSFINFIHPLHIIYFYNVFKSRKWFYFNSYKECDLTYAKYQGKYELTNNIEKNMGKEEDKKKKPMIFEVKYPPKIDLFKQYYEIIIKYQPELLKEINWI